MAMNEPIGADEDPGGPAWVGQWWPVEFADAVVGPEVDLDFRVHRGPLVGIDSAEVEARADLRLAEAAGRLTQVMGALFDEVTVGWESAVFAITVDSNPADGAGGDGAVVERPGFGALVRLGPGDAQVPIGSLPEVNAFVAAEVSALLGVRRLHMLGGTDPVTDDLVQGGLGAWNVLVFRWSSAPRTLVVRGGSLESPGDFLVDSGVAWLAEPRALG